MKPPLRHIAASLIVLPLLTLPESSAQEVGRSGLPLYGIVLRDASDLASDAASFFTAPLRFSANEWAYAAGAIGSTVFLFTADETIRKRLSAAGRSDYNGDAWDLATLYGSPFTAAGVSVTVYAVGLVGGNQEIRTTGKLMGESLVLAGATGLLMQFAAGRSRPGPTGDDPGVWDFKALSFGSNRQSFPSGHSIAAFAVSTVLAERTGSTWGRILFYGLAASAAVARVHNSRHWFSDVVVGSGLGLLAGLHVVSRERDRPVPSMTNGHRLTILPSTGGVTIIYRLD